MQTKWKNSPATTNSEIEYSNQIPNGVLHRKETNRLRETFIPGVYEYSQPPEDKNIQHLQILAHGT